MAEEAQDHHPLPLLEALRKASKALQNNPIATIYNNHDTNAAIEALLELATQADPIISTDPSLLNLAQLLNNLKNLLENLEKLQSYGLRSLLRRQITNYNISQVGYAIEAEIQAYVDRKHVESFVETMNESEEDGEKVEALVGLETRLSIGFDKEYQELILKAKVFSIVEFIICESLFSNWVKDQAAVVALALVQFNKDVFVGLVLMGPIIGALISMGSCRSIQVLTSLVRIIRTPLVDDINEEIPRIIGLLSAEELNIKAVAMNCVFEIGILAREEVIEAMLGEDLVKKLMDLQRLEVMGESKEDEGVGKFPFLGCVGAFAVQVEVGEGLEKTEKRAVKLEILKRVREASVSEAEAATVVSEVLWGSSP
ncbi:hypothetical protein ABKV19_018832 [Rosa sericea]